MKKIVYYKHSRILYSIILNMIICTVFICIFPSLYSLGDEREQVQMITDGFYHMSFSNYFLFSAIGFVQRVIYPLNAYVIVHLVLSLIAFIAITRVFLDRCNILFATCATLFISGFFAINHYVTVSFSHLPSLLTITGFLCVIHYAKREKWIFGTVFGMLLAIVGSTYRFQMFEMSCAVAAFYILGKSLSEYFCVDKDNRKIVSFFRILFEKKRFIICLTILIISFTLNYASDIINTSTPELNYYKQYTLARSAIWDYPIPDYEVCKEEYDSIGIDENDIAMFRAQYMDDEGAFPLEKLYQIKEIKTAYDRIERPILQVLKEMIVSEVGNVKAQGDKGIASVAGGLIVILFIILMKKRNYFIPACLIIITALDYSYLWMIGRPVFRGVYMTWLGMVVFLLYSISYSEARDYVQRLYENRKVALKTIVVFACVIFSIFGIYFSHRGNFTDGNIKTAQKDINLLNYMNTQKNKKYEISRGAGFNYNPDNNFYYVTKRNTEQNYLLNKGTYYKHPYYIDVFKDFGTENYYSNLLNDGIYFVDSIDGKDTEMMQKYLQKYYSNNKTVSVSKVDSVNSFNIYKFKLK